MTRLTNRIIGLATLVALMTPAVAVQAQSGNTIQRIDVREGPDQTILEVVASRRPTFTVFKLAEPPRLFIDVVGADITRLEPTLKVSNGVVSRVHALAYEGAVGAVGRFVIEFEQDASYDIKTVDSTIRLLVDGTGRTSPDLRLQAAEVEAKRLAGGQGRARVLRQR